MVNRNLISILVIVVLLIIITIVAIKYISKEEENELLNSFNSYVNQEDLYVYESHTAEDYVYSLYQNSQDNKLGIMEFTEKSQNIKEEYIGEKNAILLLLNGEFNNYIGIKFQSSPEKVKLIKLVLKDEKSMEIVINSSEAYTDTFIQVVEFSIDDFKELIVYDKNGEKMYSINN